MTSFDIHDQARISDEIDDLRSYLGGIPAELRNAGAFAAYEARLQELNEQLLESEYDEQHLSSEITELSTYLSGLPQDIRSTAAFAPYYSRLRELQDRLLALRLAKIANRYQKQLALPAPPAPRKLLADPAQVEHFTQWFRTVETAHEKSASRYLSASRLLNALVAVSGAAVGISALTTSAVLAPVGIAAAIFAVLQLALRPAERSRDEQKLADRVEVLRQELETLGGVSQSRAEPPNVQSGRLQHALQVLKQTHPD